MQPQQDIGGTEACIKILMRGKKWCDKLLSNNTFFADIWFRGVKTTKEEITKGVDFYGLANTSHKGLFRSELNVLTKDSEQ